MYIITTIDPSSHIKRAWLKRTERQAKALKKDLIETNGWIDLTIIFVDQVCINDISININN